MHRIRLNLALGGLILAMSLLAACGGTTATSTTAASSAAPSASSAATSPSASRAASAAPSAAGSASPAVGSPTRAATPATPGTPAGSPTRPASPGAATPGTPTSSFTPAQGYIRLGGQPSHRQRWNFTGFTVAGLSGNLQPVYDVVGTSRKVTLPNVAGITLEAYQVANVISVPNPIGGGFAAADASNPLAAPAQALFALPDALVFTLAPVNASYTAQGTQTVNGRPALAYRAQVPLADLGFVSPTLQGQSGTATTTVYLDSAAGYLVAMESTIQASAAGTTATARLDVSDVGQVPAIAVPK